MAIYSTPKIGGSLRRQLDDLDELRDRLGRGISSPANWVNRLRREVEATAYASSIAIEGFSTTNKQARLVVDGGRPKHSDADADADAALALACYLHAMKHVGVMARDAGFEWHERVILDLHFDACSFQAEKHPGALRTAGIQVTAPHGATAFEGPEHDRVPALLNETISWLSSSAGDEYPVVKAAMAHLQLASIHPFEDGNGRVARIVQSLVLAREGGLTPELGSIEEFLAEHTSDYYGVLQQVQKGSYQPQRDATEWVEFCVAAHIAQADRRVKQVAAAAARWSALEKIVESRGWPDRLAIALEQSLADGADRAAYCAEAGVAAPTASGDFRRLVDAGLVERTGGGPSTMYAASAALRDASHIPL